MSSHSTHAKGTSPRSGRALSALLALAISALGANAAAGAEPPVAEPAGVARIATSEPVANVRAAADALVIEALAVNFEGAALQATVEQRMAALDQARALYLPAIDLQVRYSRAEGGREIELPVGDLMNPVYATLNQLLAAQGQPAPFQPIDNVVIPFLREREQQSTVTLTQPLYDPRIAANRSAAEYRLRGAEDGLDAFRNQLARDVRQGYYRWLGTREQVTILEASLETARENQRVNASLYRAGRITRDLVYRAEADVLELEQARLVAQNGVRLSQAYVNLLRSTRFDAPLPEAQATDGDVAQLGVALARSTGQGRLDFEALQAMALEQRPELRQLDAAAGEAVAGERAARAAFKPQLALVVDAGSQGEQFSYGTDDRYVLASAVLRFNLSNGGADRAALREALAASDQVRATRALAAQRIGLEVLQALQDLEVSQASLLTAGRRVVAAEGAFRIASRKRDLGQLGIAEFIDGRRALTEAQQSQNRARTSALGSLAALEYAVGQRPRAAVETAP